MKQRLNIAFFGSSLVSAYWNGAATYYRGIVRALADRGHRVTFYEPAAYSRQDHRDIDDPSWAEVVVYPVDSTEGICRCLEDARRADVIIKASGVGIFDEFLEEAVPQIRARSGLALFWDVDAPATLSRLETDPRDPFRRQVGQYDLILTYGGGKPVVDHYTRLGARGCVPIYNGLDPETHHPVPPRKEYEGDLAFLGNRLPDREERVEEFFLRTAELCPTRSFLLGGSGWRDKALPSNIRYLGHVKTTDHNAFNCTPTLILNISRNDMAQYGFSPATRIFEAAGAAACLITDHWEGIDFFFEPGKEILVARDGEDCARILKALNREEALEIGQAAFRRALSDHTYDRRIDDFEMAIGLHSRKEKAI